MWSRDNSGAVQTLAQSERELRRRNSGQSGWQADPDIPVRFHCSEPGPGCGGGSRPAGTARGRPELRQPDHQIGGKQEMKKGFINFIIVQMCWEISARHGRAGRAGRARRAGRAGRVPLAAAVRTARTRTGVTKSGSGWRSSSPWLRTGRGSALAAAGRGAAPAAGPRQAGLQQGAARGGLRKHAHCPPPAQLVSRVVPAYPPFHECWIKSASG